MRGRKVLFGNEIANPSVGRPRAPRAAMTSSTFDVTEVTAPGCPTAHLRSRYPPTWMTSCFPTLLVAA